MARVEGPPEPIDQAGAFVDDVFFFEAGIRQRLLHGEEIVGRAVAHEAARAAVDLFKIGLDRCLRPGSGIRGACIRAPR